MGPTAITFTQCEFYERADECFGTMTFFFTVYPKASPLKSVGRTNFSFLSQCLPLQWQLKLYIYRALVLFAVSACHYVVNTLSLNQLCIFTYINIL